MGFIDKLKKNAPTLKRKAADLAREHGDKADTGIDKAADLADRATKGKYAGQVDSAAKKAKDAVDDLGGDEGKGQGQGTNRP